MSTTVIGPRRAIGWKSQFGYKEQFGAGAYAFASGAGSAFPFASMPVAQAFRYWWAVQNWRVQWNFTDGVTTATFDSGWIPWGCGWSDYAPGAPLGVQSRRPAPFDSGDGFQPPRLADRYVSSLHPINNLTNQGFYDSLGNELVTSFMGSNIFGPYYPVGLVWDDITPGNVFMAVSLIFQSNSGINFPSSLKIISGSTPSAGCTASLDGLNVPLYGGTGVTGSVTIDTKDT
jgi:hypothetical protein